MKSRYEDSQKLLWGIQEACFFLCLLSVAEEELGRQGYDESSRKIDLIDTVRICLNKGYITEDFTVRNDCAILEYLTCKRVTKEVVKEPGFVADNQYTIEKWIKEGGKAMHFKRRYFDVYVNPNRKGYIFNSIYKYTFED